MPVQKTTTVELKCDRCDSVESWSEPDYKQLVDTQWRRLRWTDRFDDFILCPPCVKQWSRLIHDFLHSPPDRVDVFGPLEKVEID